MKKVLLLIFLVASCYSLSSQAVYNGSNKHTFTTNYGIIDIGPFNSSWAHIYSNRPKFIFNKPVWIQGGVLSSYSSADLWFQTNSTTRMKILNSNGYIGVGTDSPQSIFHIKKGSSGGSAHSYSDLTLEDNDHGMITILTPNNRTSYFGFADQDDDYVGGMQYRHDTNMMTFRVNNHSSDMVINQDGNVGIGHSDPGAFKLRVNGQIRGTDAISVETGGSYKVSLNGITDSYIVGRDNALQQKFRISSNGDTWFTGGDVGIGTSSPDEKLTVKGKIHAEEVRVDLSVPGPDYVFKDDYELRSLPEVREFIETHGHLPNIPSAEEMETHGVELGAMEMKLLEKIEELTLYLLDQQKRYDDLEQRTQLLEQQLKMK